MKKLPKFLCITLILVLMLSMVAGISVKAAENEPLTEYIATEPEDTEREMEEPMLEVLPSVTEETASDISALLSTKATFDDGKYRQKAVIWTVNGESVEYTYNGKDNNYNQLLMHTLWYKDAWRAAYCIEPGKTVFVNSDYDEEENSGVDPWGQLPFAKQRGVSLTLLYGYPNGLDSDDLKTQIAYQLATYLIVHEIILGWRQDVHPFARTNDHYFDVFGGGTPDDPESLQITSEFYSSVHEKYLNSEDIWYAYNYISDKLATHDLVPSFASKLKSQAPTHTMKSNGDGTYSITLTDTNNILASYDFTNTDDLKFKKSSDGKSLTITTSNKTLGTITVSPTRDLPSVDNSAFLIWNSETDSQELCSLKAASDDPVPAYFKVKLPLGKLTITKTTEDDKNVDGWQFNIYSNAACTKKISGPHTTNSKGKVTITGLESGTVWIKEIGHEDSNMLTVYECVTTAKDVTIMAGATSTVTFNNKLIPPGKIVVTKTTSDNKNLAGWQFGLYADKACTDLIESGTTNSKGKVTFHDVMPSTVWIKELGHTTGSISVLYTCDSDNPQKVTVKADTTSNVSFVNTLLPPGKIIVTKTTSDNKHLSGWQFGLYSNKACTDLIAEATSNSSGKATFPSVEHGDVWVKELGNSDSSVTVLYECTSTNPQKVTVKRNQTSTLTFENTFLPPGIIVITKTTSDDKNLSGWQFGLYSEKACTNLLATATTNSSGVATFPSVEHGDVWVKELGNTKSSVTVLYECSSTNPQKVTVKRNQTSTLTFENTFIPPGKIVITKTTSDGKNLSNWQFGLYSEKACTNLLATATTNSSGEATFPSVEHGDVWVMELGNTKSSVTVLYECSSTNPQKVTVQRNKTSKVTFENELLPPGNVSIMKTTSDRKNLSGWQFNIYSDRTCTKLISGPHTSGSDGQIVVSDLNPGTIWVKEIGHTDPTITGYYTCVGYNPVKVTIMSNKTVEVHFRNDTVPDGSVHLIKTTNCGTGLSGWQFSLYSDHGCTKLVAGPYITDAKGTLDFPNLKPGVYWIKELGNEDPVKNEMYICDSLNPQKVLIVSGRTSTVSFHNIILTGSITVSKTDPEGNTLPGAQFLLEWSNDGVNWKPVNYSDSLGIGTTSTQGVENGLQTTDEAGHISYAGLNPDLQYRLYEVKAPEGYQLLSDYVFQGKLTGSDLSVTVTAVNSPVYTLPHTGSNSMMDMSISIALCLLTCLFPIFYFRRKEN